MSVFIYPSTSFQEGEHIPLVIGNGDSSASSSFGCLGAIVGEGIAQLNSLRLSSSTLFPVNMGIHYQFSLLCIQIQIYDFLASSKKRKYGW